LSEQGLYITDRRDAFLLNKEIIVVFDDYDNLLRDEQLCFHLLVSFKSVGREE